MKEEELWVAWTHDALSRYETPEDINDVDEAVDDMADVATKYADAMLSEYKERFSGGTRRRRKPRKPNEETED